MSGAEQGDLDAIPYRFPDVTSCAAIIEAHQGLKDGESSGVEVSVAGRIMLSRPQGRLAFAELRDWTGSIQLFALHDQTQGFDDFIRLSLGDWVGAHGEVVRTRRGELSVKLDSFVVLARARRGFGDKWHGVNDPDIRYRQREVDLWANEGAREIFLLRSKAVSSLRKTLDTLDFVEVETPMLQALAGGANARPFLTHYNALHEDYSLRIATELYLKRLVVGGFERVYEIGKDFRNEGLSPRHNPEFTMLEAYQAYADYLDMAELIETLVSNAARDVLGSTVLTHQGRDIDLSPPWKRATMEEVIFEVTGVECRLEMDRSELVGRAHELDVEAEATWSKGKLLVEIYERRVEHELWDPVHVMDYPVEVSPLTRRHRRDPGRVERLTPILAGREIGEAYSELVDPDDQRERFEAQAAARAAGDEEAMPIDEDFLAALEHGLAPTGGIGIGVDRLVMLLADQPNIREVILFPALRAPDAVRDLDDS